MIRWCLRQKDGRTEERRKTTNSISSGQEDWVKQTWVVPESVLERKEWEIFGKKWEEMGKRPAYLKELYWWFEKASNEKEEKKILLGNLIPSGDSLASAKWTGNGLHFRRLFPPPGFTIADDELHEQHLDVSSGF